MGVNIAKYRSNLNMVGHLSSQDDFAIDSAGRLVANPGEYFEAMPVGILGVIAYVLVNKAYTQNPYTVPGISWEISFSSSRIAFYSAQTSGLIGVIKERKGESTLGFFYYPELRSISLGSSKEAEGAYVSMAFAIDTTKNATQTVGVRVQGSGVNLRAFATMLVVKTIEYYANLSKTMNLDISALSQLFNDVNDFNWAYGEQTDFFLTATQNSINLVVQQP